MYIGTRLNVSDDALDFGDYSDRWINIFLEGYRSPEWPSIQEQMSRDLSQTLQTHVKELGDSVAYGWKEPRSIYLLPFFHSSLPGLKFLHLTRDGRDMAFSANQNQMNKHSEALLGPAYADLSGPARSIALWNRINMKASEYGEQMMGADYLRLRFEDLCAKPEETVLQILEFFGLRNDRLANVIRHIDPPPSLGRWKGEDRTFISKLEAIGAAGLQKFGYL